MVKDKHQILQLLNRKAQDQYGEFGFETCSEDEKLEIIISVINENK